MNTEKVISQQPNEKYSEKYNLSFAPHFIVKLPMDLKSNKIFKGKIIIPKLLGGSQSETSSLRHKGSGAK